MESTKRIRAGFTLVELLVVIAIIAILAAILFPVFAQAREAARTTVCLSNVKQLSLGAMMYVQDYDENFPSWVWGNSSTIAPCSSSGNPSAGTGGPGCGHFESIWFNAIYPYVKNAGVYRWNFPRDQGSQFLVKIEVIDQAGNVAHVETPNAIILDITEPHASVVGVSGMSAQAAPQMHN